MCIQRKLFSRLTFAFQNERGKKGRKRKSEGKRKNTFVDRQHGNNGGYANTGVCTEYSSHDGKILSRYNHAFRAQIPFYQRRRNRSETTQKPVVNETAIARHRARSSRFAATSPRAILYFLRRNIRLENGRRLDGGLILAYIISVES